MMGVIPAVDGISRRCAYPVVIPDPSPRRPQAPRALIRDRRETCIEDMGVWLVWLLSPLCSCIGRVICLTGSRMKRLPEEKCASANRPVVGSICSPDTERKRYVNGDPKESTRGYPNRTASVMIHGPIAARSSTHTWTLVGACFPEESRSITSCRCTIISSLLPSLPNQLPQGSW